MADVIPFDIRFSPTILGIVQASFINFLRQHPRVRGGVIVIGLLLVLQPVMMFLAVYFVGPNRMEIEATESHLLNLIYMIAFAVYVLYLSVLAGPGFNTFVAPSPETVEREKVEGLARGTTTPTSMLELDSARLAEYYSINQSQARSSFRWAVIAFIFGVTVHALTRSLFGRRTLASVR
jgi:hypothetical protein